MIPGSNAYSHLCQTNVSSYAIAGSWRPNAIDSHESQEWNFQFITDNLGFNLDRDGFHDDNDLVVSVTSQLGGLGKNQIRQPESEDLPITQHTIYSNTLHASLMIKEYKGISSESNSTQIKNDVITLLGSSEDNKFANAIGIGSVCHPSK